MKKKDKAIFIFILKEVGIKISPMLEAMIKAPNKLATLNHLVLEQVVKEFAPVYKNMSMFFLLKVARQNWQKSTISNFASSAA